MVQKTSKKIRDKNRQVVPSRIKELIIEHLGIASMQDGDLGCKIAKAEALEELPHAILAFAAEGFAVYAQNSILELYGMHAELYQQLQRIADHGEAGIDTIETFRQALEYVVTTYCTAYALITEEEREAMFRRGYEILVATYPLYPPNDLQKHPGKDSQGRLPFPRLVVKEEE